MIFSAPVIVSVLSLFSSACALTVNARQGDCSLACPDTDATGNALSTSSVDDATVSCSYTGELAISCIYDAITGLVIGDSDGCLEQAVEQCLNRRSRQLKHAVVRRAAHDQLKRDAPPPAWEKPSYSQPSPRPKPSPSPSPSWHPSPQPPKQQPCNYRCPLKDLAKGALTDEAIRYSSLYCSYPSSVCKSCSFCKYSTKTGLLLEDNDNGNCPQSATAARPWDRRDV